MKGPYLKEDRKFKVKESKVFISAQDNKMTSITDHNVGILHVPNRLSKKRIEQEINKASGRYYCRNCNRKIKKGWKTYLLPTASDPDMKVMNPNLTFCRKECVHSHIVFTTNSDPSMLSAFFAVYGSSVALDPNLLSIFNMCSTMSMREYHELLDKSYTCTVDPDVQVQPLTNKEFDMQLVPINVEGDFSNKVNLNLKKNLLSKKHENLNHL